MRFCRTMLVTVGLLFSLPATSRENPGQQARAEVEQVLRAQQAAWNRHDLQGFMSGYWNSPALTFFSGDHVASGWQAALERYRRNYLAEGKEMGKLDFSDLRIELLALDSAFVRGAFHLALSDGMTRQGLFTLVFRRFPDGWKIIHDHTSTAE